ncbi:MAG: hypothetical protein O2951_10115 [Bacteroidetes bacterium]|nr:hypothetical protein [Bacteroidota bacterium]
MSNEDKKGFTIPDIKPVRISVNFNSWPMLTAFMISMVVTSLLAR